MITILFHNITIRIQRVHYDRRCYNSDTNCDLKFFSFPNNPQRLVRFSKFNVHGSVHNKNILIYIQQDATLHSLFYLETALRYSGR